VVSVDEMSHWFYLFLFFVKLHMFSLHVHRELAVSNEVHEALWLVLSLIPKILFLSKLVGINRWIVFLLKEDLVWRSENAFKLDHKLCD